MAQEQRKEVGESMSPEQENKPVKNDSYVIPVLPLKNTAPLPRVIMPIVVGRDISIRAVEAAMTGSKEILLVAQKNPDVEVPEFKDLYKIGVRAGLLQVAKAPTGGLKLLAGCVSRARILESVDADGYLAAHCEDVPPRRIKSDSKRTAILKNLRELFSEYIKYNDRLSEEALSIFDTAKDIDSIVDSIAMHVRMSTADRQRLLEMVDEEARALRFAGILVNEIEILKADQSIKKRIQSQLEKNQRDYYLNEQIRAIQKELGRDDYINEIEELRNKAKKLGLSEEARSKVESECKKLERMQPTSPEAAVSRNYIDWLLAVPWKKATRDTVSLEKAKKILDASHAGMKKAKERILEFVAAKKFAGDKLDRAPIICFVGPPGVGKTSLAITVAKALGRKFVRISLGGLRDEAEIRGHRRTYIGAMPGKIIQAMKKAGVVNPVILLDEIDKMAADFRGDPASAMLEVLDPEQNKNFNDHFLDVDYDLSKVVFIATANIAEDIPYALYDRMEVVELYGYTSEEKIDIAKQFLLPKVLKAHNLSKRNVEVSDETLRFLIESYTKEAGVRKLEEYLTRIVRKCIQEIGFEKKKKKVSVKPENLQRWFGPIKFKPYKRSTEDGVGVATGLAWTAVGGEIMEIESAVVEGKGSFQLTGQLGEVMQESGQAALTYIRTRAESFGLKPDFNSHLDIHVHVPEGAIPKDGPSAGITMAVSILSAVTGVPTRNDTAMTGEITLRGRVLPVGGLKEKLLAAIRNGIKRVLAPEENKSDISEFYGEMKNKLEVIYVSSVDEVVKNAFREWPVLKRQSKTSEKKKPAKSGVRKGTEKKAKGKK